MHALRSLSAHSNNLEDLPASVGGLVSLELCDLSSNRCRTVNNMQCTPNDTVVCQVVNIQATHRCDSTCND